MKKNKEITTMKYSISGDCKTITIYKENGYFKIKEENGKYYIYRKYNGDDTTYYMECMDNVMEAINKVGIGYIEIF